METKSRSNNSTKDVLKNTFSVYSNELANAIYIDLHSDDSSVFYVVYDKKGEIVKENRNLSKRNTLSLHPFPSGLYTIEINGSNKTVVKTILRL
ncbi:T9SS type A sorting domain-containing protein [Aquimarina sp. 2201CG14-23]|uniref:T9SS type A sorting domain-containing protein n=1 Tax=Aquimarina mycalae TaxID=3040073 RepID=UPI002477D44E|nr:T9SS type A sorting domain-containing protein [Aquimarina sp. 2201CG14-23]MDH7446895.1 T9SS type A sorting domain-containing protein [Aquimarina sp. 2201CG14-23]